MKLGIFGAQCSGKTTKLFTIANGLTALGIDHSLVKEGATLCPYEINENVGYHAEMWILNHQIEMEKKADILGLPTITDRTIYDVLPYSNNAHTAGNITSGELQEIYERVREAEGFLKPYDELWFCQPFELNANNPRRSESKEFQELINQLFWEMTKNQSLYEKSRLVVKR